jgi:hypothetical protein
MSKQEGAANASANRTVELCAAIILHAYYDNSLCTDEIAQYFGLNPRRVQPRVSDCRNWGLVVYGAKKRTHLNPTGARTVAVSNHIRKQLHEFEDNVEGKYSYLCRLVEQCREDDRLTSRQNRLGAV